MKKPYQFWSVAVWLKLSCLRLQPLILTGIIFLLLISPACSTIRLQINQFTQKPSALPRDLISPEEDSDIVKESACVITVNDDSGPVLMGKEQVAKERITEKVGEKLKDQTPDKQIVYLEIAATVQYQTVVSLLNLIRKAEKDKVGLVVIKKNNGGPGVKPSRFEVKLPSDPDSDDPNIITRPNPLTLVVELGRTGTLLLNKEEMGQVGDTTTLIDRLTSVFKDRESMGVFREGTNEVEKTVFIKAALSTKYGDVVKVIDAVKTAGASPIGLQIDYLAN